VVYEGYGLAAVGGCSSRARCDLGVVLGDQHGLARCSRGVCGLLSLQKLQGVRGGLAKQAQREGPADRSTCLPGDAVNVSVKVTGKEELDIEEGRVALVCSNHYVYQYESTDSDNNTVYRTKEATDEVAAADERILEEKTIQPGATLGTRSSSRCPLRPRRARAARSRTSNGRSE
jgi:hypothetical protein